MKQPQRSNRPLKYPTLIPLIVMLILLSVAATSSNPLPPSASQKAIASYLTAQQDPNLDDEAKIKAAIDAYFTLKYEGQKLLEPQDFSILIEKEDLDWVKMEKDKRDIEIYLDKLYESRFLDYKYTLDYDSITISGSEATVHLRECNEVKNKRDLATSYMGNLPHLFILHKIDPKGWVIYQDEYQDELSQGLALQTKEELLQKVNENYEKGALLGEQVIQPENLDAKITPLPTSANIATPSFGKGDIAKVPRKEAENLSDEEIVKLLMSQWLEGYKTNTSSQDAITDYKLKEVFIQSSSPSSITAIVTFDVQPVGVPNNWAQIGIESVTENDVWWPLGGTFQVIMDDEYCVLRTAFGWGT